MVSGVAALSHPMLQRVASRTKTTFVFSKLYLLGVYRTALAHFAASVADDKMT